MFCIPFSASRGATALAILTAAAALSFPPVLRSDDGTAPSSAAAEELLRSLEASESLYRNLDVQWDEKYEWQLIPPAVDVVLNEKSQGRSIRQDGMLFLNYEGRKTVAREAGAKNTVVHHRVGYDGETTRLLEHRGSYIGNIRNDVVYNWRMFNPHAFPLRHSMKSVPLSVRLRGRAACLSHPFGSASDFEGGRELRAQYDGEEDARGLRCARVTLLSLRPKTDGTRRVSGRRVFWLARERNFLPVRSHAYNHYYSKDLPIEEAQLTDLREIEPGIWFPYGGRITVFDELALRDRQEAVVSSTRELTVRDVSLKPRHDVAFFQDVTFPDGTAVYTVIDGAIVESRIQGRAAASMHSPAQSRATRWGLLVVGNVVAVLCAVAIILRAKKRA